MYLSFNMLSDDCTVFSQIQAEFKLAYEIYEIYPSIADGYVP
jgi:hypothetical protein